MKPLLHPARPLLPLVAVCCLLSAVGGRAEDAVVYADQEVLSRWSEVAMRSDADGEPFHGTFGNRPVSLALEHLPRHRWVKGSFDLYLIGSWDGGSPVRGPDLWSLSVRDTRRLIFASFCGWGDAGNDEQSYPDYGSTLPRLRQEVPRKLGRDDLRFRRQEDKPDASDRRCRGAHR